MCNSCLINNILPLSVLIRTWNPGLVTIWSDINSMQISPSDVKLGGALVPQNLSDAITPHFPAYTNT